jgi:hypothetical protein
MVWQNSASATATPLEFSPATDRFPPAGIGLVQRSGFNHQRTIAFYYRLSLQSQLLAFSTTRRELTRCKHQYRGGSRFELSHGWQARSGTAPTLDGYLDPRSHTRAKFSNSECLFSKSITGDKHESNQLQTFEFQPWQPFNRHPARPTRSFGRPYLTILPRALNNNLS